MIALKAAIVGCGRIAGGFVEENEALTHAGAYRRHPGFDLIGCVDHSSTRAAEFAAQWGVRHHFQSIDELLNSISLIDVVSICTPTPTHAEVLKRLLQSPVRAVICEKPLTEDGDTAARLVAAYSHAGKLLAVNYTRRWHAGIRLLATAIRAQAWGTLHAATLNYSRGLLNTASHGIDLLADFFGAPRLISAGMARPGALANDPACDVILELPGNVPAHLVALPGNDYALFEIEMWFANACLRLEDFGREMRLRPIANQQVAIGLQQLDHGEWKNLNNGNAFYNLMENVYAAVTAGERLHSDGQSALIVQRICDEILSHVRH